MLGLRPGEGPLAIDITARTGDALDRAKGLCENLLATVMAEFQTFVTQYQAQPQYPPYPAAGVPPGPGAGPGPAPANPVPSDPASYYAGYYGYPNVSSN